MVSTTLASGVAVINQLMRAGRASGIQATSSLRQQVPVTSSDAVWMLSKQYALIHESVDLHANDHRIVVLQSAAVTCHTRKMRLFLALTLRLL